MRQAMLVRLNQIESLWNVLKTGNMLAGSGPTRTKMCNRTTHEALISLAFLGTTAITLADQRQRHGIVVPPLTGPASAAPATSTVGRTAAPAPVAPTSATVPGPPAATPGAPSAPAPTATGGTPNSARPDPARQALTARRKVGAKRPDWTDRAAPAWLTAERDAA